MSGNILSLGNKIFEIPPFFQPGQGIWAKKVQACSLRFSALNRFGTLETRRRHEAEMCLRIVSGIVT